MRYRLISLVLATALLTTGTAVNARADAKQTESFNAWKQMGECAKQAAKQFPDHTPEGNAKREAARQECLRTRHLPTTGGGQ
jgi:hypothetical protein